MIWKKVKEDKPLKYFPLEEIIKEPGLINIAITARGYGKTYAFVKWVIKEIDKNKRFVWMRRDYGELRTAALDFTSQLAGSSDYLVQLDGIYKSKISQIESHKLVSEVLKERMRYLTRKGLLERFSIDILNEIGGYVSSEDIILKEEVKKEIINNLANKYVFLTHKDVNLVDLFFKERGRLKTNKVVHFTSLSRYMEYRGLIDTPIEAIIFDEAIESVQKGKYKAEILKKIYENEYHAFSDLVNTFSRKSSPNIYILANPWTSKVWFFDKFELLNPVQEADGRRMFIFEEKDKNIKMLISPLSEEIIKTKKLQELTETKELKYVTEKGLFPDLQRTKNIIPYKDLKNYIYVHLNSYIYKGEIFHTWRCNNQEISKGSFVYVSSFEERALKIKGKRFLCLSQEDFLNFPHYPRLMVDKSKISHLFNQYFSENKLIFSSSKIESLIFDIMLVSSLSYDLL